MITVYREIFAVVLFFFCYFRGWMSSAKVKLREYLAVF